MPREITPEERKEPILGSTYDRDDADSLVPPSLVSTKDTRMTGSTRHESGSVRRNINFLSMLGVVSAIMSALCYTRACKAENSPPKYREKGGAYFPDRIIKKYGYLIASAVFVFASLIF